ncbi:ferritin-like domain-containing protein [Clostridium cellulovorans]|uniref:Rubrerythrin n=1 Tax=Clostridium cellulovorans (strain ATCC 35296 / DSM 3052 / OCM 3 / 743B) TaxID=573061 RepID=D9SM31_CLOC7|nr:ferritin-like domain-containing protein [Clostridium cellulovorans]ADL51762.1 Rubrerythrin [Clostridium cellulovorans 743B]
MYITPYQNNQVVKDILFKDALEALSASAEIEREDELFFDYLITVAPTQEAKDIIASIRDDERRHNSFIRQIYREITGNTLEVNKDISFETPTSYEEGLKKALFSELEAVERYKKIRSGISGKVYQEVLFDILTDELIHAAKHNYLMYISNNGTGGTTTGVGMTSGTGTGGTITGVGMTGGTGTGGTITGVGMTGGTGTGGTSTSVEMTGGTGTGGTSTGVGMTGGTGTGGTSTGVGMTGGTGTGGTSTGVGITGGTGTGSTSTGVGMTGGTGTGGTSTGVGITGGTGTGGTSTGGGITGGSAIGGIGIGSKTKGSSLAIGSNMGRNNPEYIRDLSVDHWLAAIEPLVIRAQAEAKSEEDLENLFQFYILAGVLVGLGKNINEAIEQVEQWQAEDDSKLLFKNKTVRGYIY